MYIYIYIHVHVFMRILVNIQTSIVTLESKSLNHVIPVGIRNTRVGAFIDILHY